ncbi:MAG: hypothetical protein D3909_07005, partial [Candidatus Electrothrix sp. ATG1]|nr:hypothetical protein [Candidatus Electrothrix sp. ATG1]
LAGSRHVWSPDGEQILYAVYQRYNDETHQMELEGDLILVNPDTKEMTELTNDAWFDTNPSWSPDGEQIVFSSDRAGLNYLDIWIMDKNGNNKTLLFDCSQYQAYCSNPVFSPDGLRVAFSNGGSRIYTINTDGDTASLQEIAAPGYGVGPLDWSPFIAPPAIAAQATPYVITAGESTTLSWESSGAVEVHIGEIPDKQPITGSLVVSPQETTTYTLKALGPIGAQETTVTVTVD